MSELIVLGVGVLLLLMISYVFSRDDFFSPSFIVCAIFFVSVILAIRDVIEWKVTESIFTGYATFLLLLGISVFVVTEQLTKAVLGIFNKKIAKSPVIQSQERYPLHPSRFKKSVLLLGMVALVTYYCYMTYRYTVAIGYSGGMNFTRIASYRHAMTFAAESFTDSSRIYRFSKYIIDANVFVSLWILLRNIVYAKDSIRNNITYIIVVCLSLPTSIINSSRGFLLQIIGSGVFIFYIMMRRRNNWRKPSKTFRKILFWSFLVLILSLFGFYYIQANGLFGRETNRSLLDHVTMYLGDPILNFYDFIDNPPKSNVEYFGQETFAGLNNLLVKLHIRDIKYSVQLEYRNIQDHRGNIYTFFRRPFRDFGVLGMCIVTSLTSFIFTYVYYKKIYMKKESMKRDFILIVYSYFFYIIYLFPMICQLCNMVYFGMVYYVLSIFIVYRFLCAKHINVCVKPMKLIVKKYDITYNSYNCKN